MRARWLVIGALGTLALFVGGLAWVASSDWLRQKIAAAIVENASAATGGRVELDGFSYDWRTLTVKARRLVIHGREPAGAAPLLETGALRVELRIVSLLAMQVSPGNVDIATPRVHLIVQPDGSTNLPAPKVRGNSSAPETILNLKIAKFALHDGSFTVDVPGGLPNQKPLDARGENLRALFTYDTAPQRYSGDLSLGLLRFRDTEFEIATKASMERNRVVLRDAVVKTKDSQIQLAEVVVDNLSDPVTSAKFDARVSLPEALRGVPMRYKIAGWLHAAGTARYRSPADYEVKAAVDGSGIAVDQFRNIRVSAAVIATSGIVSLDVLRAGVLGGEFVGTAEVRDFERVSLKGRISRFGLAQLTSALGAAPLPYDGIVSGQVEGQGTTSQLSTSVKLTIDPAKTGPAIHGIVSANYDSAAGQVNLGSSWLELPHSRIDVTGTLGGRLDVKAASSDFADVVPLLGPNVPKVTFSSATFNGTVTGPLTTPQLRGAVTAEKLVLPGLIALDSVTGDIAASSAQVSSSRLTAVYGGVPVRASGTVGLTAWRAGDASPVSATVETADLELAKILELARHPELPATGRVSGTAQISGTLGDPRIAGDATLGKGEIYSQPFDSLSAHVQTVSPTLQTVTGLFISGPKRVNISARFEHAGTTFPAGTLEFNLTSNTMPLNQINFVRQRQPDIQGFGKFHADGTLAISRDVQHQLRFDVTSVNGDASANGVELAGRNLGDARLTAVTRGRTVTTSFESNAAKAVIRGGASIQLGGDNLLSADIKFDNTGLNAFVALLLKSDDSRKLNFDGNLEAEVMISGALRKPENLRAELNITKLEVRPLQGTDLAATLPAYAIANDGPLRMTVTRSQLRIESARLKGPETQLAATGNVAFDSASPLNLQFLGNVNLALLQRFAPEITSSGVASLDVAVKGTYRTPEVTGHAQLKNGELRQEGFTNGLSNANGLIVFSGTRATIQSLTAETGGGRVDASGFAALSGGVLAFRIDAKASEVRVRYPEGISSVSDATLTLAGTSQRSLASGTVTVRRVTINPKSDAATILSLASQPLQTAAVKTGILANMNLDVQINTAPDVVMHTTVTETIQADVSLRLRGTATNPALLGRINITHGELIFFGNRYTISQGAISFFNPTKIEPIVNLDLETRARGVDVVLTVAGQVNKLNVSYRSDPPLQFSEIVALLATGRTPTDATLAARDTGQSQSLQDLGASALVGQAIANPVAGRLQRFFGVSRLKIDPRLTGITGSPQARLTLEQQITPDILFTYVTDVSNTSTQLIRVEWAMNRTWSAVLVREESGKVGLDFFYKKRLK